MLSVTAFKALTSAAALLKLPSSMHSLSLTKSEAAALLISG